MWDVGLVKTFNTHYPLPQALALAGRQTGSHLTNSQIQICQNQSLNNLQAGESASVQVQICKLTQVPASFQLHFVQTLHQIWLELVFGLHKLKLAPWGRLSLNYCPPLTLGLGWEAANRKT